MYLDQLSDDEFIRYVSLTNTDPVVARLLTMLTDPERPKNRLMDLMTHQGMDPDTLGIRNQNGFYIAIDEYLRELEFELDQALINHRDLEREMETMESELDGYRNLTITEFLSQARERLIEAEAKAYSAQREHTRNMERLQEENRQLTARYQSIAEKLDMWTTLQRVN